MRHINFFALMLPVMILIVAAVVPSRIRTAVKHLMLAGGQQGRKSAGKTGQQRLWRGPFQLPWTAASRRVGVAGALRYVYRAWTLEDTRIRASGGPIRKWLIQTTP